MTETFVALLLAHVAADFPLQSDAMAAGKQTRRPGALALHMVIVAATASLLLAPRSAEALVPVLVLTALHLAIDLGKSLLPAGRLGPFLADQGAHLLSLAGIAMLWPGLFAAGLWGGIAGLSDWLPGVMVLAAGALAATMAGRHAVRLLMLPHAGATPDSLPAGGALIGILERGLIYLFLLVDQPAAIGFLVTAKSILRFKEAQQDSEYVIIGTLASFGWALLVGYGTLALASGLPHLGIPALNP